MDDKVLDSFKKLKLALESLNNGDWVELTYKDYAYPAYGQIEDIEVEEKEDGSIWVEYRFAASSYYEASGDGYLAPTIRKIQPPSIVYVD